MHVSRVNLHALPSLSKAIHAFVQGCQQIGRAISIPAVAVLAGLLMITSFSMSHSCVEVQGTDWVEPVILWICICMPTGSGKSGLCKYLKKLVESARSTCGLDDSSPSWFLDDQSFEKMGALMSDNHCKLFGLYDEQSMFLSQINVTRGRGLSDSHELALFLQLYGGNGWVRKTGNYQLVTESSIYSRELLFVDCV